MWIGTNTFIFYKNANYITKYIKTGDLYRYYIKENEDCSHSGCVIYVYVCCKSYERCHKETETETVWNLKVEYSLLFHFEL